MNSLVCFITNNFNGDRLVIKVDGEGVYEIKNRTFSMEGTFKLNEGFEQLIGTITFEIKEIIHGNNQDFLLFSLDAFYKSLSQNRQKCIPHIKRGIWYLKLKTGLNPEEERFLRDYNRLSDSGKIAMLRKYEIIQEKIQKNIIEERERIMHILNDEKGHGGGVDLF